jgi:endoglucanase
MTFRAPPVDQNGNFKGSLKRFATGLRINASGGWFDAGDFLHFTETTSYAVAMMLQTMAAFPARAGRHGQVSFAAEAKFGVDFLRRMWNERTRTLYLQVGTGEANNYFVADHDIWRLPQADDHFMGTNPHYQYIRHPPVFLAGKPGSQLSPNLAGRLAADFALCYRVFKATMPGYARGCLRSAETIYSMAARYWRGTLETVLPWDFYPETTWRDDMMLGATELALALHAAARPGRAAAYLRDAARWAGAWYGGKADGKDTLNLYDVSALADYELYRAIGIMPGHRLRVRRSAILADLRGQIRHAASIGAHEPFDFGFAWAQWDTSTHGLGLSVMANEYDALVGRPVYAAWGQRQLDDVLGANPWGVSLIVGDGTVFPDCMQHQVANLAGSRDGAPPVLAGAVVEGPNSFAATGWVTNMRSCRANAPGDVPYARFDGRGAVFADDVQSFSTVEPAIDLTSISPLAFAWQEAGNRAGF